MDLLTLSRIQFGLTIGFHYIFPPLSVGLGLLLVFMEGLYLKTKNPLYHQMTRFWVKVFGLIFALGVATGIVMEFQFGTNWSTYSRFVGDVFGSALAAEGIFAFFLESGFLAILLFGWDKVSRRMHFISTILVCAGAHFSAIWIVVANSWQQTPAGYHLVGQAPNIRAEIVDFWQLVFSPSSIDRIWHVYMGAWQAGAFFVLSVSAFYLLRNKHIDFAKASIKIALVVAAAASILQLVSGHSSAVGVAENQPAKMAAYEAHYNTEPADLYLFGWVNNDQEKVHLGVKLPGMLSFLIYGDTQKPVTGLKEFKPEDRPPVNVIFQSYHAMVAIGVFLILVAWLGLFLWWRKRLFNLRWLLWVFVFAVIGPQLANQLGWLSAEVGRQPWIVYNLLRTSDGLSKVVSSGEVLTSIVLFSLIYLLLLILFIYLLNDKIQHGPAAEDLDMARHRA
jgi:cytochrome bd ubiquinol oxidase subunit I